MAVTASVQAGARSVTCMSGQKSPMRPSPSMRNLPPRWRSPPADTPRCPGTAGGEHDACSTPQLARRHVEVVSEQRRVPDRGFDVVHQRMYGDPFVQDREVASTIPGCGSGWHPWPPAPGSWLVVDHAHTDGVVVAVDRDTAITSAGATSHPSRRPARRTPSLLVLMPGLVMSAIDAVVPEPCWFSPRYTSSARM